MGINHDLIKNVNGLEFYKLLGSGGKTGFSLFPDFSTYAMISVWNNNEDAENFLRTSKLIKSYKRKSNKIRVLVMEPFHSHGLWSGVNPFKIKNPNIDSTALRDQFQKKIYRVKFPKGSNHLLLVSWTP